MMNISTLPELDRRRTQVAIESMLEKYRILRPLHLKLRKQAQPIHTQKDSMVLLTL